LLEGAQVGRVWVTVLSFLEILRLLLLGDPFKASSRLVEAMLCRIGLEESSGEFSISSAIRWRGGVDALVGTERSVIAAGLVPAWGAIS